MFKNKIYEIEDFHVWVFILFIYIKEILLDLKMRMLLGFEADKLFVTTVFIINATV